MSTAMYKCLVNLKTRRYSLVLERSQLLNNLSCSGNESKLKFLNAEIKRVDSSIKFWEKEINVCKEKETLNVIKTKKSKSNKKSKPKNMCNGNIKAGSKKKSNNNISLQQENVDNRYSKALHGPVYRANYKRGKNVIK